MAVLMIVFVVTFFENIVTLLYTGWALLVNICARHVARHHHDGKVVLVTLALAAIFTCLEGG